MKNRVLFSSLVMTVILLVVFTGCSSKKVISYSVGSVDNNSYKNEYFGLSLDIPTDWDIVNIDNERTEEANQQSEQPQYEPKIELAIGRSAQQTEEPSDTDVATNIFTIAVQKLPPGSEGITGYDLLKSMVIYIQLHGISDPYYGPLYKTEFINATSTNLYGTENISGVEFRTVEIVREANEIRTHTKYYATIYNNYALLFSASFLEEEGNESIEEVIDLINFSRVKDQKINRPN